MNTHSQNTNVSLAVTKLVLSCDLGGSKVKAIAQIYPAGIPCVLAMDPEVAQISTSSMERLKSTQLQSNSPTWVGVEQDYYVLGTLAKSLFAGTAALRHLKSEYALPKIAALVWLAYRRFEIIQPCEVFIQVLLPPGEVNSALSMAPRFAQVFKRGIITPTGKLKAKLVSFEVYPEGIGIVTYRSRTLGKSFAQKNIGLLMLGYRNASFAYTAKGNPAASESTALGMSWLVQQFVERTAVGLSKDDERLVSAILASAKGNFDALGSLSRQNTSKGVQSDLKLFQKILPDVRADYCRAIIQWMTNIAKLDEILICGGTADFIRVELTEHFQLLGIPIVWNGEVEIPKPLNTLSLGERVADVWTAHITYIKMLDRNFGYERKQDLVPDPNKSSPRHSTPTHEEWLKRG